MEECKWVFVISVDILVAKTRHGIIAGLAKKAPFSDRRNVVEEFQHI